MLTLALALAACDFNTRESTKNAERLRRLADETAVYPAFEPIDSTTMSKSTGVNISCYYKSPAKFEDVKRFYIDTLSAKGWGVPEEKPGQRLMNGGEQLIFRKGEDSIHIEHETAQSFGWDYSVAFVWEPK